MQAEAAFLESVIFHQILAINLHLTLGDPSLCNFPVQRLNTGF